MEVNDGREYFNVSSFTCSLVCFFFFELFIPKLQKRSRLR